MNAKFEFLFPKRVYRCPCLHAAIEECFNNEDYSIADICCYLKDVDSKNVLSSRIFRQELVKIRNTACLHVSNIWKLFYLLRKKMCAYRLKMTILFPSSVHIRRKFIVKTVWNIIWDCYIFIFILLNFDFLFSFLFQKKNKKNGICIQLL